MEISLKGVMKWQDKLGNQRDWVWRGWQIRYTFIRPREYSPKEVPLILIHGFGASIGHWRKNLEVLGSHHTVYALDLLGFGASGLESSKVLQVLFLDFGGGVDTCSSGNC